MRSPVTSMEIVSLSPFRVATVRWQPRVGVHALSVVVKGTYDLTEGVARLSHAQDFPNEEDNYWNDDLRCSVYAPCDLAPFKPRADVVLVGDAQLPDGHTTKALVARMTVGSIDKSIEVHVDRHLDADGRVVEGEPFQRMPLRYERAAEGYGNPVGIRRDATGPRRLPNLQPSSSSTDGPSLEPVGFGPIAAAWPSRRDLVGEVASDPSWQTQPLPADIDANYFSCAPPDQTLDVLHDDELIVLENLHPRHQRLACRLPGLRPRVYALRNQVVDDVRMAADTLWIDTARGVCTLTWRGRFMLQTPNDQGRIFVALEEPGAHVSWNEVAAAVPEVGKVRVVRRAESHGPETEVPVTVGMTFRPRASTLPFVQQRHGRATRSDPPPHLSHLAHLAHLAEEVAAPVVHAVPTAPEPSIDDAPPIEASPGLPERPAMLLPQGAGKTVLEEPAPPFSAAALELLFVDDDRVTEEDARHLRIMLDSDAQSLADPASTDWALPDSEASEDVGTLIQRALADAPTTELSRVGFRLASDHDLLHADLVRVEAQVSPLLSPVQLLRAKLQLAALALSPIDRERADSLRALREIVTDDLEGAPDAAWAPAQRELERSCDGEDQRPELAEISAQAEAVVLAKRGFRRAELRHGPCVVVELAAGSERTTAFVTEAQVASLPTTTSWYAAAIARPELDADGKTTTLSMVAMGRYLDREHIPLNNHDPEPSHESVRARSRKR